MTEVEFEHVMNVVTVEMGPAPAQGDLDGQSDFFDLFDNPPKAANDNSSSWPLLPFPPGWSASC